MNNLLKVTPLLSYNLGLNSGLSDLKCALRGVWGAQLSVHLTEGSNHDLKAVFGLHAWHAV